MTKLTIDESINNSEQNQLKYRRTLKHIIVLSVTGASMIVILLGLMMTTPATKYYATTTSGQVVPMHSLSQPVVTKSYLLQWASIAARTAFNLDFVHYDSQLKSAQTNFTPQGWSEFQAALTKSGLLQTVQDNKLEMSAIVSGTPVIISSGVVNGRYTWRVQLPILVTFTSASSSSQQNWLLTMNIQRISTLDAYKGIQISDFVSERQ